MKSTLKPGDVVLDPMNRRVTVVSSDGITTIVQLYGPYGATVHIPTSTLRPLTE